MPRLVYETTDTDFADRAVEALREADIPCHRIGRGYSNRSAHPGKGFTEDQVCIYIERDSDYAQANQILLGIGAVADEPVRLPPNWVLALAAGLITAVIIWITSEGK